MGQTDPIPLNGPKHHACTREPDFRQIRTDISADRREAAARLSGVHSEIRALNTKFDRVLEGLRIGAIVPAKPPSGFLDFDPDDATNPGIEGAATWKARTSMVLAAKADDEVKLIDARAKARRMTIAAAAAAVATILMAIAALVQAFGGFGG